MQSGMGSAHAVLGGRYQLAERLGAGGMAEVYRAEDLVLGRPVAVKLLHPGADAVGAGRERLRSEVRLLARLSHPGLVDVYDAGEEAGRAFVVMQLLDGRTLAHRLAVAPLPTAEALRVGAELAEVLAYLHARDLVHRDLKPSNVLFDADGRVFLADFGIARAVDATRLTSTNAAVGSASYMAPEQVRGHPAVGPAADVYALGLLLIECLTGRRAYGGGNSFEVAMARLHRRPDIPSTGLPVVLPGLLEAMTDDDPGRRPTAGETASLLRGLPGPTADPAAADQTGPHDTVILPAHADLAAADPAAGDPTALHPRAVPDALASGIRSLWRRGNARGVLGLRLNVLVVLVLLVAGFAGLTLSLLREPPAPGTSGELAPPTAPPGPQRLPADLDRLDEAVTP